MRELFGVKAVKVNSEAGDGHKDGTPCIVIAESIETSFGMIYLALFQDVPVPVAIADFRIKMLSDRKQMKIELNNSQELYLKRFPKKLFKFYEEQQAQDLEK